MKKINPNIHPHEGYYYRDGDGTKHVADSWAGVIARVKRYRARQGKPTDTVENEVVFQACLRDPVLCVEDNGQTRREVVKSSVRTRVLQWMMSKKREKEANELRFVDRPLHEARTDVCIRCPLDKSMTGGGCGSCRAAVEELKQAVVGNKTTDARITACQVLGEHLHVSTWLDEPAVVNADLPAECWRKRSL
jgi:hypothetical protein